MKSKELEDLRKSFNQYFITSKNKIKNISIKKAKELHYDFFELFENFLKKYNNFLFDHLNKMKLSFIYYYLNNPDDNYQCPICEINIKDLRLNKSKLKIMCNSCLKDPKNKLYIEKIKQENAIKGSIKKFGVKSPFDSHEIQLKVKQYWIKNHNVEHNMQVNEVKEKMKNAVKNKYNVDNYKHSLEFKNKYFEIDLNNDEFYKRQTQLNDKYFIKSNFIDESNHFKTIEFCKYFVCSEYTAYRTLKKLNINYSKNYSYSQSEKDLLNFISDFYENEIIENTRDIISPFELDIYIPEKNLAIEFNGIYWHSLGENNTHKHSILKEKHLKKTEACESKNINLLHIFENEWLDPIKQDIWKSIIKYKLNKIDKKYFARKLEIKEVPKKEACEFEQENHLQGSEHAEINIGLYDNNELISLITFSSLNKNNYKLIRFCSKKYTVCVGCIQRLFKYFIKNYNPKSIISHADRRWVCELNNIYQKLNFKLLNKTSPKFYYCDSKNKRKIYDSGDLIYIWKKEKN